MYDYQHAARLFIAQRMHTDRQTSGHRICRSALGYPVNPTLRLLNPQRPSAVRALPAAGVPIRGGGRDDNSADDGGGAGKCDAGERGVGPRGAGERLADTGAVRLRTVACRAASSMSVLQVRAGSVSQCERLCV